MPDARHSLIREGLITGVLGAAILALWYFVIDLSAGHPLRTPSTLGALALHGPDGVPPGIYPTGILVATLIHGALFAAFGIAFTALVHLASREPAWRMGLVFAVVITLGFSAGLMFAIAPWTGERFPSWVIIAGSAIAAVAMLVLLWRRHPALAGSFRDVHLGDETESPPHPPAR